MPISSRHFLDVWQSERAECLLACFAIMARMHGCESQLSAFRATFPGFQDGASFEDLANMCARLKVRFRPLRVRLSDLYKLPVPCIAHYSSYHFVVLEGFRRDNALIVDPQGGRYRLPSAEWESTFSGYIALLDFTEADFSSLERTSDTDATLRHPGLKPRFTPFLAYHVSINICLFASIYFVQETVNRLLAGGYESAVVGFLALNLAAAALLHHKELWFIGRSEASTRVAKSLLLRAILDKPVQFHLNRFSAQILTSYHGFTDYIQYRYAVIDKVVLNFCFVAASLVFGLFINIPMTAALVVGTAATLGVRVMVLPLLSRQQSRYMLASAQEVMTLQNYLAGIVSIKLSGDPAHFTGIASEHFDRARDSATAYLRLNRGVNSIQSAIKTLEFRALLVIAATLVGRDFAVLGDLYAILVLRYFIELKLSEALPVVDHGVAHRGVFGAALDLLGAPPEFGHSEPSTLSSEGPSPSAVFEAHDVVFSYKANGPPVLDSVNLEIRMGEFLVIDGHSGGGKSTLLRILMGLMDPQAGRVRHLGRPYSDSVKKEIRAKSASVLQEDRLFAGTIADNVGFFSAEIDYERVRQCCEEAEVLDDVDRFPLGVNTLLREEGYNISAGQRQRLLFARAFYRDVDIVFLDEATVNLDETVQQRILAALKARGKTVVAVSHSPRVAKLADRRLTLKNGKVISRNAPGTNLGVPYTHSADLEI